MSEADIAERITRVEEQQKATNNQLVNMDGKLDLIRSEGVLRAEYETRIAGLNESITGLRKDFDAMKSGKPQWPAVATVALAIVVIALDVLPRLSGTPVAP